MLRRHRLGLAVALIGTLLAINGGHAMVSQDIDLNGLRSLARGPAEIEHDVRDDLPQRKKGQRQY